MESDRKGFWSGVEKAVGDGLFVMILKVNEPKMRWFEGINKIN